LKQLPDNEVHVWLTEASSINDNIISEVYPSLLTADELKKVNQFRTLELKRNALVARVLIRTVLSKYYPIAARDWCFSVEKNGKPILAEHTVPLVFNISHSESFIACVVGRTGELGIDIEQM